MRTSTTWLLATTASLLLAWTWTGCSEDPETGPAPTTTSEGGSAAGGGSGGETGGGGAGGGECVPEDEICDGEDNDCDGQIDEGCNCRIGDTQDCYSGEPELIGVGACQQGEQLCTEQGSWGPCENEVLPDTEVCDGDDNDCNGATDENLGSITCGLGICQVTVPACENGAAVPCLPNDPSPPEDCEGTDDDCDGEIDEGCTCTEGHTQPCYSGSPSTRNVGECEDGVQVCTAQGTWGPCTGEQLPESEICDTLDNDCNGLEDDGNPGGGSNCDTGNDGVCAAGTLNCQSGQLVCVQDVQSSAEICNGLDDDCDGQSDEGDPGGGAGCATGQSGICAQGTEHCVSGSVQCVAPTPQPEQCNGLDDDCDGVDDDGNPGGGSPCPLPLDGECGDGEEVCTNGSLQCTQVNFPVTEVCGDNRDNDCDGETDEGCSGPPPGWNCGANKYDSGAPNDCDCGCGAFDPDCADLLVASCDICNAAGSCASSACPATIAPLNNAMCCSEAVADGGFEGGQPNPDWAEGSTNGFEIVCSEGICGTGGTGPRTGSYWAWLGGVDDYEMSFVEQTVTIPVGNAELHFWISLPYCNSAGADIFSVTLDGNLVYSTDNNDTDCNGFGWREEIVDLSVYADGSSYVLRIEGEVQANPPDLTSFMVDDVEIRSCPP